MAMRGKSERLRLLVTLGFVVFPAAALIGFSVLHLRSIQRDRAIEAAIQRDFQHMMLITEKRIARKAYDMAGEVQPKVPCAFDSDAGQRLQAILEKNPQFSHLFTWSKGKGAVVRSQSRYTETPEVQAEGEKLGSMINGWFDMEGGSILEKLHTLQSKGEPAIFAYGDWLKRDGKPVYQGTIFFPINENKNGIGGLVFDPEFLQTKFFPEMMNTMMSENEYEARSNNNGHSEAVMMIHAPKEPAMAACSDWDGGMPEMERKLEAGFPGLMLAMKFRGTTVEAIGQKFLRTSFLVLGGLSLLLAAGIVFTYRGVRKEMELAKIKSDFVSNVSHELRTPLALIRLYAETLELGRVPQKDKQQDYYCTIRKESERLTALINNILDFSRIEAGRKEYDFRETNLPELVRTTLEAYRYQIEQQGFRFEEKIADDIPPVMVDREAIARSLLNLVNNAIKYSSDDRYLGVNLRRSNGSVKLEVVDHGIGIAREEHSKIFEKFYRVCDPLVHNTKGSGLGLCLVRHIAHAHGGNVEVESVPGKGSKFSLLLPVQPPVAVVQNSKPDISQGVGVA
ncbi:MAG: sensor histidine kinase [Terriglobales bacterium]